MPKRHDDFVGKMEDSWLCIDEDSISSHNSSVYSDQVGSDVEAALYSIIHHQENCTNDHQNAENICMQSSQIATSVIDASANTSPADNENTEYSFSDSFRLNSEYDCNASAERYEKCSELNAQTIGRPLKRKSGTDFENEDSDDSISVVEYSVNAKSSEFKLPSNKNTKKIKTKSQNRPNKFEGNEVIPDSSDSDIWTEHDSSEKYNLTVNLHGTVDTITISSDSSNDLLSFSSPVPRNAWNNQSLPNIKLGENSKDSWHINSEDLYRSKKRKGRYHEHNDQQCSNCNRKDHIARFCPVPKVIKCAICGGAHMMAKCENRMCIKCQEKGHDSRRCWKHLPNDCHHCRMNGHNKRDCPDIWRRYHLTTEPSGIVQGRQMEQNRTLYCFNCGLSGHFGPECKEKNARKPSTWPCVISYDDPDDLLMNRLSRLADVNENFQPYNLNQRDQFNRNRNKIDTQPNKQLNRRQNIFATDHNKQFNRNQNDFATDHNKQFSRSQNNVATDYNKQFNRSQNNVSSHHNKQLNRSQNNVATNHNKHFNRKMNYERKLTNIQVDLSKEKQPNNQEDWSKSVQMIQEEWQRKKKRSKEHNNMKVHQFNGIRNVIAEKDFPRTPKSAPKECIQDPIPDAAVISERQRLKRKRRRARKSLNKRLGGDNSLHEGM